MILLVAAAAVAGTDAHGPPQPLGDDVLDPATAWRPEVQVPLSWSVSAGLEEAIGLLTAYDVDGAGQVTSTELLADLSALQLGFGVGLSPRVAVAMTVPTWITSGAEGSREWLGLGDVRLSVPIGVVLPQGALGFGVSVVPHLDAPTGDPGRFLGAGGLSGGGVVAIGVGGPRWQLATNLGAESVVADGLTGRSAGAALLGGLAGTWSPSEVLAVHLEAVGSAGLSRAASAVGVPVTSMGSRACRVASTVDCDDVSAAIGGADDPAELVVGADWQVAPGIQVAPGGALGLTDGVGAPTVRGFLGATWTVGKQRPDRSTTSDKLDVEVVIDDLDYDGGGSGAISASVGGSAQIGGMVWVDADDRVLGRGPELSVLPAGPYAVDIRYDDGAGWERERHTFRVGYDVRWRPTSDVSEDGLALRSGSARSYNLAAAGEEAWVEVVSGDGQVGLAPALAWPAGGAELEGEEDAEPVTTGSAVAVGVADGETPLVARASFAMRVVEALETTPRFVEGGVVEAGVGALSVALPGAGTWAALLIDEGGAVVFSSEASGVLELPRLGGGTYVLELRDAAGDVARMRVRVR